MKKTFLIFLAIIFIFCGLRLFDNGLLSIEREGSFSVYGKNGAVTVFKDDNRPIFDRFFGSTRLDTFGSIEDVAMDLKLLYARELFREQAGEIIIIYAFSPLINKSEIVHGKRVNIMVAVSGERIVYGSPIICGSY